MAFRYSIPLFLVSLGAMLAGSVLLSRALTRIGRRLRIQEQFLGFVTALGADSPEISSAIAAMIAGQKDVGVGVVFGSNLFNLAALLGLTAVLAGGIRVRREPALLNGSVGILIAAAASMLVFHARSPAVCFAIMMSLIVPYALLLALRWDSIKRIPLPRTWKSFLVKAATGSRAHAGEIQRSAQEDESKSARREANCKPAEPVVSRESTPRLFAKLVIAIVAIVAGSTGLVYAAAALTVGWLPRPLLGTFVLAVLTGIPNLYTAVRLAQQHRGAAVMTETLNSNSLNILAGLGVPALVFHNLATPGHAGYVEVIWLLAMTVGAVYLLAADRGLRRAQGFALIGAHLAFVAVRFTLT